MRNKVKRWMENNRSEYIDDCNEVNYTGLAEGAAQEFDLYEDNEEATIPEWVFDLALLIK